MSFTMSKDGHEVKMTTDHTWGVEILEIDCPYKEQLEAIKDWWLIFNQFIDSEAVKEKLEKILENSDFTTDHEEE